MKIKINSPKSPKTKTTDLRERNTIKRVLHFMINIFDTKYDIYGFLSSDDYVKKPQTRDTGESERERNETKPANWISFRSPGLGLMIVLEKMWNNTRLKLILYPRNSQVIENWKFFFSISMEFHEIFNERTRKLRLHQFYDYPNAHPLIIWSCHEMNRSAVVAQINSKEFRLLKLRPFLVIWRWVFGVA